MLPAQLTVAPQPGVCALNDPAIRLDLKAPLAWQPLNNLQLADAARFRRANTYLAPTPSYGRAEWITALISKPSVSVSRCRLSP